VYNHKRDNTLELVARVPTGGVGTQASIGSQDSMIVHEGKWLLSVNGASNDVSVFDIQSARAIALTDVEPSRGVGPNSIGAHGNLVYVLNQGDGASFSGFVLDEHGDLSYLRGSTRSLRSFTFPESDSHIDPSQIGFTPDGKYLIVIVKGDSMEGNPAFCCNASYEGSILSYSISEFGLPGREPVDVLRYTNNERPFSFNMIETEDESREIVMLTTFADARSVASIRINANGTMTPLQDLEAVGSPPGGLCWNANNGKYLYATDTPRGIISSFTINANNLTQTIREAVAFNFDLGNLPFPLDMVYRGDFIYTLQAGTGTIAAFAILPDDGSLVLLDSVGGIPPARSRIATSGMNFFNGNPFPAGLTAMLL